MTWWVKKTVIQTNALLFVEFYNYHHESHGVVWVCTVCVCTYIRKPQIVFHFQEEESKQISSWKIIGSIILFLHVSKHLWQKIFFQNYITTASMNNNMQWDLQWAPKCFCFLSAFVRLKEMMWAGEYRRRKAMESSDTCKSVSQARFWLALVLWLSVSGSVTQAQLSWWLLKSEFHSPK